MTSRDRSEFLGGASRSSQRSQRESWWLLAFGCLCAVALALCGQSPSARAETAPAPASSAALDTAADAGLEADANMDASTSDAGPFGAPPVAATSSTQTAAPQTMQHAHGLAPLFEDQPVPEAERPPGAQPNDHGPSGVIFPPQEITIRFNHKRHVKDFGLTCASCHEKTRTSHNAADSMLPPATRCDGCHSTDHRDLAKVKADASDPMGQCAFCHLGYSAADGNHVRQMRIPKPNLRFDHALHGARNIGCPQCHGDVENLELATRDQLPRMRGCFNCHQAPSSASGKARSDCQACHLTEPSGMLQVSFTAGTLAPPSWFHDSSHGPDWMERHKLVAGNDSRFCGNCHSEKYCADCHDGRVRPRNIHPNDWIQMHPIASRENQQKCTSCHREQSFCLSCHQRLGITMSGPFANAADRGRFHPPKSEWTDGPRTARHHAWEAERNISACVSCHVERDCAICHATSAAGGRGTGLPAAGGGRGTDPHPIGFQSRCGSALRQNARPCLVCHLPTDPNLQSCR